MGTKPLPRLLPAYAIIMALLLLLASAPARPASAQTGRFSLPASRPVRVSGSESTPSAPAAPFAPFTFARFTACFTGLA